MGAGASTGGVVPEGLTDDQKTELAKHMKAVYEGKDAGLSDEEAFKLMQEAMASKVKELQGGSLDAADQMEADAEALAKQVAEQAAAMLGIEDDAPGALKDPTDFRKRRLTYASHTTRGHQIPRRPTQNHMYRSQEIGEEGSTKCPFPDAFVGTFSCHGIEPGWLEGEVTAKINQDRGCIVYPYRSSRDCALFCVYDGHGENGDLVSHFVMEQVQAQLTSHEQVDSDTGEAIKDVFTTVDKLLEETVDVESQMSGTTAVVCFYRGDTMHFGWAGDSRAVMGVRKEGGTIEALDMTIDQNPNLPAEQARIEAAGGFVSPPPEPGLSARVWLDEEMTQIGLAMGRSIGDHAVSHIGVIAEPEISVHKVSPQDEFLIMASDGVWEFISSQEAVDIVVQSLEDPATNGSVSKACERLIGVATDRWQHYEGDYRDDITAVVAKVQGLWTIA